MSVVGGSYKNFVKQNFHKLSNELSTPEKMKKLGQMWRESGKSKSKGGDVDGGMFIKRKAGRKGKKQAKGKGLIGDLLNGAMGGFGLGMEPESKGGKMGKSALASGNMDRVQGKGIISDTLGAFGLGVSKKRGRPAKGKGVVGGAEEGSGLISGLLGSIGFGMPNAIKQKHYNRMVALEKQLHTKGKLTPVQHNKLKVYHTLHGAGFFDSLWSGIKKGASAVASVVPKAITSIPQVLKVIPEAAKFVPTIGKLAAPLAKVAPLAMML